MKIGLEVHVQLPTRSKMFCSCPTTDAEAPNTHVCPVCLGMPGSRPVLNRQVLVYGIMLAKMLGCKIADTTWFSRKTYFYPDMSKSVQITQYDHPIGTGGLVMLNGKKPIRITRIHLEEDPGKTKRTSDMYSLIDYNRSGVPLAEIVTEPDISTPAEAREFLTQLIADIRATIDMPADGERSIRCDCNISVGKERCEVKNVTGVKNAERALTYEMVRQIKILKAGGKIERETRNFDESRGITYSARKKEFEADYGYIDEPDLGIFHIGKMAEGITIRESPAKMTVRLSAQYGIPEKMAKQLVSTSIDLAQFFETVAAEYGKDLAVKLVAGPVAGSWKEMEAAGRSPEAVLGTICRFAGGKITDTECSIEIKSEMTGVDAETASADAGDLEKIITDFLDTNPKVLADYAKGNTKALNSAIGHVMKTAPGKFSSSDVVSAAKRIADSRI
ncbi:MAG: Asp-tRNA(Asn)/Glu-tRNA(Gln) amidotransferase subunit GatB [Candidatus Methanomethylophilus sp.]|jgi:aspartyl-tRNA(Asn)/glutamyl-tRNA(Gln) amidotransferase subunit B|nr:Asp-tRNA(Asn)/Glu-tRNA(Gln) amidotransferase subunit GatB [Methanomethylophilus sp.]MCI2075437.1 Asp-tRNA(Asn)/Glu-tRNA(Gln) amidotransferase subunit GatB [Methanomethylophilus sp.]MCI2093259.1 Asp-tRNA(Asn)/Glu-tRNA(Gln) amidotransferase subunit GatB [Methanomethylophilus sp.]MEE3400849.1 Asp-tRNA(Asn)/Glu-tRNA(Gln) amidotransferase subunit GatB [Methanomethylophilus sp.]TQS83158.1 MAG: glutamyl-tRNA amidotransferase [Methanomethylophilus alvi]